MDFSTHFICSLDFLPRTGTLLAAGVSTDTSGLMPSCVATFSPPAGRARGVPWPSRGRVPSARPGGMMSFARALGGEGELMAVGENMSGTALATNAPGQVRQCLWGVRKGLGPGGAAMYHSAGEQERRDAKFMPPLLRLPYGTRPHPPPPTHLLSIIHV